MLGFDLPGAYDSLWGWYDIDFGAEYCGNSGGWFCCYFGFGAVVCVVVGVSGWVLVLVFVGGFLLFWYWRFWWLNLWLFVV